MARHLRSGTGPGVGNLIIRSVPLGGVRRLTFLPHTGVVSMSISFAVFFFFPFFPTGDFSVRTSGFRYGTTICFIGSLKKPVRSWQCEWDMGKWFDSRSGRTEGSRRHGFVRAFLFAFIWLVYRLSGAAIPPLVARRHKGRPPL